MVAAGDNVHHLERVEELGTSKVVSLDDITVYILT
jgi:hypothetical protein